MLYKFLSLVAVTLVIGGSVSVASADVKGSNPLVWQPRNNIVVRDPELFYYRSTSSASYILSGTSMGVVEYDATTSAMISSTTGRTYRITAFAPNATRQLTWAPGQPGFSLWNNVFYQTASGSFMMASLPQMTDFNTEAATTTIEGVRGRSTYLFVPMLHSPTTRGGFPLQWRLTSNTPFVRGVYSVTPFKDPISQFEYLESDVRRIRPGYTLKTTCMLGQKLGSDYTANPLNDKTLVCPGRAVTATVDPIGFDRLHPLSSEVRFDDGGGLVEGGWWYYSSITGKYYSLYSSGAYESPDEYAGYIAVCDTPIGPCKKVMNESNSEARRFVTGSSKNFTAIGRPYPVLNPDGTLGDVIFHAHRIVDGTEVIARCTNFSVDLIEKFVAGGRGCEFDTPTTSTEVMMRIVLDYASSSGVGTHHGKGIKLADAAGTVLQNGEWFPLTRSGINISDPTYVAALSDRNEFPGILIARKNGVVTIGQFSSSTDHMDYELTDGYIEVRNGTVSTSTDPSMFIELHKYQRTRYIDTKPPVYDYVQNTASNVVAFGLLGSGLSTDRFAVTVTPDPLRAETVSAAIIEGTPSVLGRLIVKLQELISRL